MQAASVLVSSRESHVEELQHGSNAETSDPQALVKRMSNLKGVKIDGLKTQRARVEQFCSAIESLENEVERR